MRSAPEPGTPSSSALPQERSKSLSRKLWLSTVTVAIALLAVFAGSAVAKTGKAGATGGTLTVDLTTDVDYTDANGAKGSQLTPEAAAGFPKVSNSGKTYDFTVNAGFTKFSNGQPVTAANFKAAIDRDADPKMNSPALPFFSDIVGADKSPVSGVQVKGKHLIVHLTHASPDFLARVAM